MTIRKPETKAEYIKSTRTCGINFLTDENIISILKSGKVKDHKGNEFIAFDYYSKKNKDKKHCN